MKTLRCAALALAVSGVFTLGARAGDTTNAWWNVDFEALADYVPDDPEGAMVKLTNTTIIREAVEISHRTWEEGEWVTLDGDETTVTNSYFPTNTFKAFGQDTCLKLDTQGNDLTWTPAPTSTVSLLENVKTLVDADLYLVGSDSAPDTGDFDAAGDVQTAIYLKNETDEDSGETTNSVLCVYAYDSNAKANYWQELKGVALEDNAWAHVQVLVDHSLGTPMVRVYVNNTQMTARDGDAGAWTVANTDVAQAAKKVSSVSFRGTGAVDNFVGVAIETTYDKFDFTAEVYMNGTLVEEGDEGNVTRVVNADAGEGKFVTFANFRFDDYDEANEIDPTYALSKIEIIDLGSGAVQTFTYSYDVESMSVTPSAETEYVVFTLDPVEGYQTGPFTVSVPTVGATADSTIVKIYFETLPADGDFKLKASQNVGSAPPDQTFNVNTLAVDETTFTFAQTLVDGGKSYILSTITVGDTPAGIEAAPEGLNVVVTVPLNDQIAEGIYNVASATYVEGTLADGEELKGSRDGNVYTYTKYTPPVAIIVAGVVTNEYDSLRGAITNATAGDTIYLLRDDAVSFTAEDTEIVINKALTIDGGSNTLYGVSNYAYDGVNDHDIFISAAAGDVTIKDLKITEFSDTAPTVQQRTYPIWSSQNYAGKLTLDGVQIDKFARGAINLNGGTFEITNCVIAGYAGAPGAPESYFQNAITVKNAKGTVAETTVTGIGTHEGSEWGAGVVTFNSNGDGEVTFLSGTYTADYVIEVSSNATGRIIISNGTFIATAPKTDEGEPVSAFQFDEEAADRNLTVTISGGWFDRKPEAGFIADGLAAYEDAPGTDAPWTVRAEKFTITFMNGETKLDEIEVQKNGAVAYAGETPVKEGTDQYSYTFAGWSTTDGGEALESLPDATADATYYAVFTESVNKYEVEWIVDGVYSTNEWDYGATPSWDGENVPTKASTDATNFTFKAWDPAVVAVTGFASYTATWTETAREYAVTFKTNGVVYATVQAEWNATDYAPAAPAAPDGKVFKGWAAEETPTTVLETLPAISGEATYVAVFDDDVVEPPEVDVGDNLLANDGAPMEFAADGKCTVRFRAPATGVYVLLSSTTVNGTYVADEAASATKTVTDLEDNLVELTEGTAGTTKFFKIGWSAE